jgi:hypothetical protein
MMSGVDIDSVALWFRIGMSCKIRKKLYPRRKIVNLLISTEKKAPGTSLTERCQEPMVEKKCREPFFFQTFSPPPILEDHETITLEENRHA